MPLIRQPRPGAAATVAMTVLALVVASLLVPSGARAELEWLDRDFLFDRWTNADGLPVNGTTDVHIGERGYLWLTTFDGLVRFDGNAFKTFDSGRYRGLPGNRLTGLIEQDTNLFWVLTEQYALASFDGRRFYPATTGEGLPADRVLKLHLDRSRRLWVGTDSGLALACGPNCFREISGAGIQAQAIQAFAESGDGRVWVGTATGRVARVTVDGVAAVRDLDATLGLDDVRTMIFDNDGVLWAGGRGGLARIDGAAARRIGLFDGAEVTDLEIAPGGDVLAQSKDRTYRRTTNGWVIDHPGPVAGHVRLVSEGPDGSVWRVRQTELFRDGEPVVRASCAIRDFVFDSAGGIWLATLCDGLWRIRQRRFETITGEQGLPEGPVYGMVEDDQGQLWASAGSGVVVRIRDQRVRQRYRSRTAGHVVGTVALDRGGRIWVGGGGICMIVGSTCRPPEHQPEPLGDVLARTILEDREGRLWVGGQAGLWRRRNGEWRDMHSDLAVPEWVQVQVIFEADDGALWFGTDSSGLRRLSPGGDVVAFGADDGLSSNRIRDLLIDESGRLWVATADRGLCRSAQPATGEALDFGCLGEARGLHSDSLHRLLPDDLGRFWFNSNSGVFWVHREALEEVIEGRSPRVYPRVYTERDGLPDREGNGGVQNAGTRLADGRLAFPGQGGIAVFDPARVHPLAGAPKVVLETIRLPDESNVPASESISLPLGERTFSVQFAGIKPGLTGQTYFRYRLDEGPWVEIGDDRSLTLDSVRPGRHELEIAAVDADSGLSGESVRMAIAVPSFFHERIEVRLLALGAVVALIVAWLMYRRRVAIRQQQFLHREVERQTSAALREHQVAQLAEPSQVNPADSPADSSAPEFLDKDSLAHRTRAWVEKNIDDGKLSVARLADALFMSRSKLHRQLVKETGRSPGEFIRDVQLGIARQMLQSGTHRVSDVAFSVGFSSVSGFSRAYRSQFGEAPSATTG